MGSQSFQLFRQVLAHLRTALDQLVFLQIVDDPASHRCGYRPSGIGVAGAENTRTSGDRVEDLGADSLDVVELVMALEEKFDIEIPDDEAEKIQTVKDVVDYIESK